MNYKLPKSDKLTHIDIIDKVFKEANWVREYPFQFNYVIYEVQSASPDVKILFAVSKKRHPHAVDRNRTKRLMRELYRLNNHKLKLLCLNHNIRLAISIHYLDKNIYGLHDLTSSYLILQAKLLRKLKKHLEYGTHPHTIDNFPKKQ